MKACTLTKYSEQSSQVLLKDRVTLGGQSPLATKPRPTVQWEYSQANLYEQDAEQQVLASLSNQKPERAQYSVPEVKPCGGQVTHKPVPDYASDLPKVPEEIKPIDVVLRVIKHQTAGIPAANNAKKSVVKDSSIQTSPDHLIASPVSRESLNKSVSFSTEVHSRRNNKQKIINWPTQLEATHRRNRRVNYNQTQLFSQMT